MAFNVRDDVTIAMQQSWRAERNALTPILQGFIQLN